MEELPEALEGAPEGPARHGRAIPRNSTKGRLGTLRGFLRRVRTALGILAKVHGIFEGGGVRSIPFFVISGDALGKGPYNYLLPFRNHPYK